jgi:hypothetical protein
MGTLKGISESKVTVIIKQKENIIQSIFKDLVTFSFIAFCVYISKDSTWWTFITGGMFLIFSSIKISSVIDRSSTTFDNTEDAIEFLNKQQRESK